MMNRMCLVENTRGVKGHTPSKNILTCVGLTLKYWSFFIVIYQDFFYTSLDNTQNHKLIRHVFYLMHV